MTDERKRMWNGKEMSGARLAMHGRLLRCPMGDNPLDCPLYEIRKLSVSERIAWLDAQTDEQVEVLFKCHLECLDAKRHSMNEEDQ